MCEDVFDFAAYAKSLGMDTSLLSNGSLIDPNKAEHIARLFDSVTISIDSWAESEYSALRPGTTVRQVFDGLRCLVKAGVQSLAIRPVVSSINLASLAHFPEVAKKHLGITRFFPAVYLPNTVEELEELELFPDPVCYQETMASFARNLEAVGGTMANDEFYLSGAGKCGAADGLLSIATNGDVYPCQSFHKKGFFAGNIRDMSLGEMLQDSEILEAFRQKSWPWFELCKQCALMTICNSTCRVFEDVFCQNEELFFERMCPFFQKECERKLWREADKHQLLKN